MSAITTDERFAVAFQHINELTDDVAAQSKTINVLLTHLELVSRRVDDLESARVTPVCETCKHPQSDHVGEYGSVPCQVAHCDCRWFAGPEPAPAVALDPAYITVEVARIALPLIREWIGDEYPDPDTAEWSALFAVQLHLERMVASVNVPRNDIASAWERITSQANLSDADAALADRLRAVL